MSDFRAHLKGNGVQLINFKLEQLTSDPGSLTTADEGRFWYRSDTNLFSFWDGAAVQRFRATNYFITSGDIQDGTITDTDVAAANVDGTAATPSLRTTGFTGNKAMPGTARLDQIAAPNVDLSLASHKLINVTDGTASSDAATVGQLSSVSAGKDYKESVFAATVGTETYVIAGGAVTSMTGLTAGSALGRIDGQEPVVGSRLLIKNAPSASGAGVAGASSTQPANGLYTVTGGTTTTVTVTRATDADASAEISSGLTTFVEQGTTQVGTDWTLTTPGAITLNTTAITFAQTGTTTPLSASLPLTLTGMALALGYASPLGLNGSNQLTITSAVPINLGGTNATTAAAARTNLAVPSRYSATFGDTVATSFTFTQATHGLRSDSQMLVQVWDVSVSPAAQVQPDIAINDSNGTVTVSGFVAIPTSNQYRVVVIG